MRGVILTVFIIFIVACTPQTNIEKEKIETTEADVKIVEREVDTMKLTSNAFENNGAVPSEFTCDGDDISPPLAISEVPENTKSLALVMDDPDAPMGTWDHWVVWNIPTDTKEISKGSEPQGVGGKNSWGRTSYGGPCPPSGTHRYFFKLYALDTELDLAEGSTKKNLENAIQGHIIAEAQLMGTYEKQKS